MPDLNTTIAQFGTEAKAKLANPGATGEPEDQLRAPLERLFAEVFTNFSPTQLYVRAEWKPVRRWEVDTTYYYYSSRRNARSPLDRHRFDLRLGWRASESFDVSAGVQSLTPGNRVEFSEGVGSVSAPVQPSAYLRLGYRF